jgi:hypothetical protein
MRFFDVNQSTKNVRKNNRLGDFLIVGAAPAMCAILQHTPEKPSGRSVASHLSIAL